MRNPSRLAAQPRPRALVDLEQAIAGAEANRDRHRQAADGLTGADRRRAEAYLRIAEDRLAQLYRSREVLVSGEEQDADGEQTSAL
jgi:hypothetical protein